MRVWSTIQRLARRPPSLARLRNAKDKLAQEVKQEREREALSKRSFRRSFFLPPSSNVARLRRSPLSIRFRRTKN
ncbi:hypothetical protein NL676_028299 [Syzygium grande]|nr:hypothetical protein NL676_028299 [Syzygium grande]